MLVPPVFFSRGIPATGVYDFQTPFAGPIKIQAFLILSLPLESQIFYVQPIHLEGLKGSSAMEQKAISYNINYKRLFHCKH